MPRQSTGTSRTTRRKLSHRIPSQETCPVGRGETIPHLVRVWLHPKTPCGPGLPAALLSLFPPQWNGHKSPHLQGFCEQPMKYHPDSAQQSGGMWMQPLSGTTFGSLTPPKDWPRERLASSPPPCPCHYACSILWEVVGAAIAGNPNPQCPRCQRMVECASPNTAAT